MHEPAFSGLLLVVAVAFAAPFLLGFFPSVRLPAVVLEIDETISVLATIGRRPGVVNGLGQGAWIQPRSCRR